MLERSVDAIGADSGDLAPRELSSARCRVVACGDANRARSSRHVQGANPSLECPSGRGGKPKAAGGSVSVRCGCGFNDANEAIFSRARGSFARHDTHWRPAHGNGGSARNGSVHARVAVFGDTKVRIGKSPDRQDLSIFFAGG